jgi:hypothetical protein
VAHRPSEIYGRSRGARCVQAITISNVLLEQERLASEKSKAVGSQQKRQRLCFRPPHVPPDTFGLSDRPVTERAPMSRLGKRVVLLRLFYGGEMQKCDSVVSVCFFHSIYRNHVARILFKAVDERRPPDAPQPPLCFGLRVVQNPRSPFFCALFKCVRCDHASAWGRGVVSNVVSVARPSLVAGSLWDFSLSPDAPSALSDRASLPTSETRLLIPSAYLQPHSHAIGLVGVLGHVE